MRHFPFRPSPGLALVLSVAAAMLTGIGGAIGASLVFDHGFSVETAGDSPVWHRSEQDRRPGDDAGTAA